ncbi:hypothetical protein [Vibrio metschnikovii]|uniref:hypothetical protein n=1 Tax=Vibrio metschnikovii TaxID=28172 RepID=UPI001C3056DA|nr:hypothetical protein [Vibrio metschnikovii]
MRLEEQVAELLSKYLIHDCRELIRGKFDVQTQADFVTKLTKIKHFSEAFEGTSYSYGVTEEYESKLIKILENRSELEIKQLHRNKYEVIKLILTELLIKTSEEASERKNMYEQQVLKNKILELEAQIEFGKGISEVTLFDRVTSRVNLPYFIILILMIVIIFGLSMVSLTTTMTVNVDFSIGEIIGGLLIGSGVAAAGISYATKVKTGDDELRNDR